MIVIGNILVTLIHTMVLSNEEWFTIQYFVIMNKTLSLLLKDVVSCHVAILYILYIELQTIMR